jgi:hypothetical protein
MGYLLYLVGRQEEAVNAYQEAIRKDSEHFQGKELMRDLHNQCAECLRVIIELLDLVLRKDPSSQHAKDLIAFARSSLA